jgi:hypothetical protein
VVLNAVKAAHKATGFSENKLRKYYNDRHRLQTNKK